MFVLWSTTYQNEFCHHFNTRTLCAPFTKNCSYLQCSQESQSLLVFCFFFSVFFSLTYYVCQSFLRRCHPYGFLLFSAGNTMDCYVWKDCLKWPMNSQKQTLHHLKWYMTLISDMLTGPYIQIYTAIYVRAFIC